MEVLLTLGVAIIALGITSAAINYIWPKPERKPGVQITNTMGPLCQECHTATYHRTDGTVCCETPGCQKQWQPLSRDELDS